MKRVLNYIGLAFSAAVAFSACDKNLDPTFDDKNAFVAFEKTSYSVSEDYSAADGATYRIHGSRLMAGDRKSRERSDCRC